MCEICLQTPCNSRCPNAPEPPVVCECIHCEKEIRAGDGYFDIDGEPWCESCVGKSHTIAEVDE